MHPDQFMERPFYDGIPANVATLMDSAIFHAAKDDCLSEYHVNFAGQRYHAEISVHGEHAIVSATRMKPIAGWQSHDTLVNPRTPSVPASLDLSLDSYFAAAALIGLLSSQAREPDMDWARDWSFEMGAKMAEEDRRRRHKDR